MRREITSRAGLLAGLGVLALLALPAPAAVAHGEEEEATAEIPARTLVQQALALLTQQDNAAEAQEKLEAALESEHQEDVQIASVREALEAIEKDDHETAIEHMNKALAPEEAAAEEDAAEEEMAGGGAAHEEEAEAGEEPEPAAGALEHAEEFEPARGTAEWIGLGVGVALIALAGIGLTAARRRPL